MYVDADLVHSGVGLYFQNLGLQWVQSLNGMMSCQYMLSIGFKRLLGVNVLEGWCTFGRR